MRYLSAGVKRFVGSGVPTHSMCSPDDRWRSTVSSSLEEAVINEGCLALVALPALEPFAQVAEEAAGEGAVDEPVVVRQRDVHQRPNRDHVLAELVLHDPWSLHERVRAENRGLRLADHRCAVEGSVAAGVRDRERAALDIVR